MYISNKVYRGYLSMTVFYLPIHIKCSCIEFTKSSSKPRAKFKKKEEKKKGEKSKVNYFRFCTQPPGPGLFVGWATGSAWLGERQPGPWGGQGGQAAPIAACAAWPLPPQEQAGGGLCCLFAGTSRDAEPCLPPKTCPESSACCSTTGNPG